ncbi:hypothetical protein TrVFT333_009103 [Trichoderma virens FT-333]|nr:hypothetical protein TrVFT333_009103 [Trichoderma virens FT-333]
MTLLALPDEVLFEICHQVDPQSMISLKSDDIPLNNLSKTCRRLGCIAQKVLYRSVRPRKLGRFLCTIIARPELAAQDDIEKIDIDFERPCYSTGHPLALDDYYDSFKAFDKLERLSIRTTLFGTKDEDGEGLIPKFPADVQDLVAKLPGSLTSITFFGSHKDWNGIMVLAEAIKQGYFPRLKEVLVEQEEEESERSRKLLAACGVYYEEIIRDLLYCSTCDIDTTIIYVTDNEEIDSDNNEEIDSNTDEESDN